MRKLLIVSTGILLLAGCQKTSSTQMQSSPTTSSNSQEEILEGDDLTPGGTTSLGGTSSGVALPSGETVTVDLKAGNFTFGQNEIRAKLGDKVVVKITNSQGTHDFLIDEFSVNSGIIPIGETKTVEFVASKKGTFEYYCSVGSHRQMGMKGNLVVE